MSFGGGGSGAAAITAHIHSDQAGEGGALRIANSASTTKFRIGTGTTSYTLEALL
jgi:hypothetical protein